MKLTRYTSALAAFLLLTAAAQSIPVSAFPAPAVRSGIAAEEDTAPADETQKPLAEGTIGETITWTLDAEGTLTITGSGDMAAGTGNLFGSNAGKIKKAVIKNADSKNVITAIGAALFKNCIALADVTLPSTVTTIGSEAFLSCTALQKITLPDTLQSIGASAFAYSGLTEVNLPGCTIGNAAFYGCASLKNVTIGEGTELLPSECFRKCTALETVTLPDSLKEIACGGYSEQGAFSECAALKKVSIGKSIEKINQYAFRTTGEGLEITFREGVTAIPANSFKNRTELAKVILPDTLTAIGQEAFCGCSALTDCVFPESLKEIGSSAFYESGLTEAVLPGCTLGNAAFYGSKSLKTVTIGEGTELIPSDCFRKCTALESVTLPDSLKEIGCGGYSEQGAFAECQVLADVTLGRSMEKINQNAFRTVSEDLTVTFREGITAIPDHMLDKTAVSKLILPKSVAEIGPDAVSGCSSLQEIVISAADCKIEDSEKTIPASAVITAAEGSTAQQYAKKYERAFKEDLLPGDLNGDKVISADDAQLVLTAYTEALAGMEMNLTAAQIKAGDIDGNGIISVEDAQYILTYYTENTVAGKDITWDDILPKKDTKA